MRKEKEQRSVREKPSGFFPKRKYPNAVRIFLIALQFLTIFPIKISLRGESAPGGKSAVKDEDFGRSLLYFPIIGALIGTLLAVTSGILNFLPHSVLAAFIMIISIIVTGGIHLDGFADTCDGFYGTRTKEEILEIMRDSRTGVMGVVAIVCILLLKLTLLISIPKSIFWKSLIMMSVFARWSQVLACYVSEYPRKDGKAKFFIEYASQKEIIAGGVFIFALFLLLAKAEGIILLILSFIPVFLFINYVKRKISGMTGDTIGATSEIAEVTVLFVILILQGLLHG